MNGHQGERLSEAWASRFAAHRMSQLAGRAEHWLPERLGCRLAVRFLGLALGPGVRAGGPGSCSPATVGPPKTAGLARCLACHRLTGRTAGCLEQEGSAANTDSCSTALGCKGPGLVAGQSMQSLKVGEYGPGSGHRLTMPGGG